MTESHHDEPAAAHDDADKTSTSYDGAPTRTDDAALVVDPQVRDAVRRLDELSDLPPADHVDVYESLHSRLAESLAEASRQAEESPADADLPS